MSTARKILDLHGQDMTDLAKELQTLPQGRYLLVPEHNAAENVTPEEEAEAITRAEEKARRPDGSVSALMFGAEIAAPLGLRKALTGARWSRHKQDGNG